MRIEINALHGIQKDVGFQKDVKNKEPNKSLSIYYILYILCFSHPFFISVKR